jgi:DNA processing protein
MNTITPHELNLFYQIALSRVEYIGPVYAQKLLQHFNSPEAIFKASVKALSQVEGLGNARIKSIRKPIDEQAIMQEMAFMKKHHITPLFWSDDAYPKRLKYCADAPLMLFTKGSKLKPSGKNLAIVGTRKNTDYGCRMTEELIDGLKDTDVNIISGLAYGIDAVAHRRALQCGLPTFAVLAHGLDRIYPPLHKSLAKDIIHNGALITEYPSGTNPDRQNFPLRNRIVAGLSDVIVVVETGMKGGAIITAKLGIAYNREVAAFPGRIIDNISAGCNYLIKTQIAHLITNADDLLEMMNWHQETHKKSVQAKLFTSLSATEMDIVNLLKDQEAMHIDELMIRSGKNNSTLAALLLSLEFQNIVKSLPGKRYRLC